jgi:hypothetical protein
MPKIRFSEVFLSYSSHRKQRVLLLSERARRDTEKLVSHVIKECTEIDVLTRRSVVSCFPDGWILQGCWSVFEKFVEQSIDVHPSSHSA